jgi:hypothetical protein
LPLRCQGVEAERGAEASDRSRSGSARWGRKLDWLLPELCRCGGWAEDALELVLRALAGRIDETYPCWGNLNAGEQQMAWWVFGVVVMVAVLLFQVSRILRRGGGDQ